MTTPTGSANVRLARDPVGPRALQVWAASIVLGLGVLTAVGLLTAPIALLAAGAGAGYSLSGSV